MPPPRILPGARCQADWSCNDDVKHVQSPGATSNLGEKLHPLVTDPHEPAFIQLATADDIGGEARDVVGIVESLVRSVHAGEEDGAAAFDLHNGAVAEPHRADDAGVDIREGLLDASHVVGGPHVEDPLLGVSLSPVS
jgi:hypothetical protein